MRIAIAGFQHETNTFAPMGATFEDFLKHDAWPGLTRGTEVVDAFAGLNLPIAGFTQAARAAGHELMPALWASAEPSSYVTRDAFERVMSMICEDFASGPPVDAVYLDLHGAMVAEGFDDGEGEILRRVRQVVGAGIPVVASLDLHANVTPEMVEHADAIAIFRTYPHVDMAHTGARAHRLLQTILDRGPPAKAYRQVPYLTPLSAQSTREEPNRSIYRQIESLDAPDLSVDYACGFPPSDIRDCGASVVAYGSSAERVEAAADGVLARLIEAEPEFVNALLSPREAVRNAMESDAGPVVIADVQDNPGAGATSDTTGLLEALVEGGARGAVLALLQDPEVAEEAHHRGVGGKMSVSLGGKLGTPGVRPWQGRLRVAALGDGRFTCTGEMYRGTRTELGPMALLQVGDPSCDVSVVVGSERFQCLDQAVFRHVGIEPAEQRIVVVKSTVHFRADFDPIAERTLLSVAPGAHPCILRNLDYRKLRAGVRLEPCGPEHRA